jgi:chemotaxis-related protein WspB
MLMLVFRVGEKSFSLPTAHVVEVVPRVRLREVPGAPDHVAGLLMYRGGVLPVVDLSQLLGGRPAVSVLSTRIVIFEYRNTGQELRRIGVIAEGATETINIDPHAFDSTTLDFERTPYLGGVATHEGSLLQLIHMDRLLAESLRATLLAAELPAIDDVVGGAA